MRSSENVKGVRGTELSGENVEGVRRSKLD